MQILRQLRLIGQLHRPRVLANGDPTRATRRQAFHRELGQLIAKGSPTQVSPIHLGGTPAITPTIRQEVPDHAGTRGVAQHTRTLR